MVAMDILRLLVAAAIAFVAGKLIAKLKLPSILGWLIDGDDAWGPTPWGCWAALCWIRRWFDVLEQHCWSAPVGLMIGTELIWQQDEEGRQADRGHHHHRIGGHLPGGQPGLWRAVPGLPDVPLYLAFLLRRHRAGHCAGAFPVHCYSSMKTSGPVTENADPDGRAG